MWLDTSEGRTRLGIAGTNEAGEIEVAVLYAIDLDTRPFNPGGAFDTSFGGTGYAAAPASIYKLPSDSYASTTASGLVERDDLPSVRPGEGENEWLVSGTVTYSPGHSGKQRSREVIVDFRPDGSTTAQFDRGHGAASFDLYSGSTITTADGSGSPTAR